jgi:hypothetical protein
MPLHYMLLTMLNVVKNWQCAQISTPKKYAQISKTTNFKKFYLGVFDTPEGFLAPKMLKSAPKWLRLMPEILKMQIFVTQFNFKVSKFRLTSTNCNKLTEPPMRKSRSNVSRLYMYEDYLHNIIGLPT